MKKVFMLSLSTFLMWNFIYAQNKLSPGDTLSMHLLNFDDTTNVHYIHNDTSLQNIWQIGRPQKNIFSNSLSGTKAIVTDTISYYPINNHSYFDLYIGSFNLSGYWGSIHVDFRHKFNTDSLKDGLYITVSWDKGSTWKNIIEDTIFGFITPGWGLSNNMYTLNDSLYNGELGFSGNSNGWVYTSFLWEQMVMKQFTPSDTMIIRFNFISDSINNNKDGWMIDDIRFYSREGGGGIHEFLNNNISISPNPFTQSTQITLNQTYHNIVLSVYDIQGKLMLQNHYVDCDKIQLNRNQLSNGLYFLKLALDDKQVETGKIIISE
jgi:hypothetical protein